MCIIHDFAAKVALAVLPLAEHGRRVTPEVLAIPDDAATEWVGIARLQLAMRRI
jgi:hypothetical protein